MSQLSQGKVAVISKINKLVRELNNTAKIPMTMFPVKNWNIVTWADAAWAVRADGTSQGGYFVGLVEKDFLRGKMGAVTPLAWTSWKLHRVAKSSSSAEVQAVTYGMEEMDFCRIAVYELERGMLGLSALKNIDEVAA